MTKMRTRKPKKARQRPHAKSIAGFKIKQKYSVGAVSPDHGVLKQGELQQLRASKSLGYDKYGPGSAPIPKGRRASRMEKSPVYTPTSAFADMNLALFLLRETLKRHAAPTINTKHVTQPGDSSPHRRSVFCWWRATTCVF